MNKSTPYLLVLGIILVAISVWQIYSAQSGITIITLQDSNPPLKVIMPANVEPASRPTILIAHGFAGSAVLMRGFALTLAHAGYITISWDFQGHGLNPSPFTLSAQSNNLLQDADSSMNAAMSKGLIDFERVAILGHSMGSGVALSYGISHPDTAATVAISPVNQAVTPDLPHNMLLLAGSWESRFVNNAVSLLNEAGGKSDNFKAGSARDLVVIPNVEHISILFSPKTHARAHLWLDDVFGAQPGAVEYTDRRMLWYAVGIIGFILIANACLSSIPKADQLTNSPKPFWLKLLAMLGSGFVATIILWLISLGGIRLNQILGLLVGGYMLFWFGVAGLTFWLILRPEINKPNARELIKALLAFAILWLGVGLLGNYVWLPWLLIPQRLLLWIPGTLLLLPWFFMIGNIANPSKTIGQFTWWIFQTITIVSSLFISIKLNPELGFIFILLPLVPVMIGLHLLVISPKHGSWSYSLSGAMFTSWLILAVFPLQ